MNTGIPVEIMYGEGRVALIPAACSVLTSVGHKVFMETRAGLGSGYTDEDYSNAGVPMLTVTHGRRVTRNHILAYTLLLAPVALGLGMTSIGGPAYMVAALAMNLWFVKGAIDIQRRDEKQAEADGYKVEKTFFRFSLYYLFLHFGMLLIEATLRGFGIGGW